MPNANAEAQRRWRQRQKQKKKEGLLKAAPKSDDFREPFFKFYDNHGELSTLSIALNFVGYEIPEFVDDRGPEAYAIDYFPHEGDDPDEDPFEGASNSLGRAELLVGGFLDAAITLAGIVNNYKKKEIEARLGEIEVADLSDPKARKAALKDAARLHKMLDQLDKQVRWTFPQWKVKS